MAIGNMKVTHGQRESQPDGSFAAAGSASSPPAIDPSECSDECSTDTGTVPLI